MKKRMIFMLLSLSMCVVMFSGCTKTLSGTYSSGVDIAVLETQLSYTFSGNNVTITLTSSNIITGTTVVEYKGKYTIDEAADKTQTITFTFEDENAKQFSGMVKLEELTTSDGKQAINLGGITYIRK